MWTFVNSWCACAAGVITVVSLCVCVCFHAVKMFVHGSEVSVQGFLADFSNFDSRISLNRLCLRDMAYHGKPSHLLSPEDIPAVLDNTGNDRLER